MPTTSRPLTKITALTCALVAAVTSASPAPVVASLAAGATLGACTTEATYTCDAWCGTDFSTVRTFTLSASDWNDAYDQCFDSFRCPGGEIEEKCDCMEAE